MKKIAVIVCTLAALLSLASFTAFAEEATDEAKASYSYLTGQQRSQGRNSVYAQAARIESDEERKAFLNEQGIGEIEWSEEAAANFSYVAGQKRGASYRTDDTDGSGKPDMSSYSYLTGQQRGSSYQK